MALSKVKGLTVLCFLIIMSLIITSYNSLLSDFWPYCAKKECRIPQASQRSISCTQPVAKSWDTGMVTRLNPYIPADCEQLSRLENGSEVRRVQDALSKWNNRISDESFIEQMENCSYFRAQFEDNFYTSRLESDFPVAFYLTVHDHLQQFVRLLRVIYRPHNVYCIHPDAKSRPVILRSVRALSRCFENILIPKNLINVFWGLGESILEAQLECLEILKEAHDTWNWHYVLNLCGTELPLVTNRRMVEYLQELNGTTYITLDYFPLYMKNDRFSRKYKLDNFTSGPYLSNETFGPPSKGITLYKSLTYNMLSYKFAEFVLTHEKALELREYVKGSGNSEEHFYATLYQLPEAPVGRQIKNIRRFRLSGAIWRDNEFLKCHGEMRNEVCIIGVADLRNVIRYNSTRPVFFMNKYFYEQDHVVMDCAEKNIVFQNQLEYERDCAV